MLTWYRETEKQLKKQVLKNQWGKYWVFEDECCFEGLGDWLAPGALPALQLQQRHRTVPVRGDDGRWPQCSLAPPCCRTDSPCPQSPSPPEGGQSLLERSWGTLAASPVPRSARCCGYPSCESVVYLLICCITNTFTFSLLILSA